MTTVTPTNPWEPPVAPALTETEAVYRIVTTALAVAGRSAETTQAMAAIVALLDASRDLLIGSGLLWHSKFNMADVLRSVADELDRMRREDAPQLLLDRAKAK